MPEGAVYVGRPSIWGNPWRVVKSVARGRWVAIGPAGFSISAPSKMRAAAKAVDRFRELLPVLIESGTYPDPSNLRGHDLACWCPLDKPCHADVLLELANREVSA